MRILCFVLVQYERNMEHGVWTYMNIDVSLAIRTVLYLGYCTGSSTVRRMQCKGGRSSEDKFRYLYH